MIRVVGFGALSLCLAMVGCLSDSVNPEPASSIASADQGDAGIDAAPAPFGTFGQDDGGGLLGPCFCGAPNLTGILQGCEPTGQTLAVCVGVKPDDAGPDWQPCLLCCFKIIGGTGPNACVPDAG